MIDLLTTAKRLQIFCDERQWRTCFIGGIAVQRWGEPRVTRDVDLALLTGFGDEREFVEALLAHYPARIGDAREFALRNRVLLLGTPQGIGIDISLAALPFEKLAVERATDFEFAPNVSIRTCSAEDLLIMKLFASRPLDLRDAETIVIRNRQLIDWRYVEAHLGPLAEIKEEPTVMSEMRRLQRL